jgi:hypothetical protein
VGPARRAVQNFIRRAAAQDSFQNWVVRHGRKPKAREKIAAEGNVSVCAPLISILFMVKSFLPPAERCWHPPELSIGLANPL